MFYVWGNQQLGIQAPKAPNSQSITTQPGLDNYVNWVEKLLARVIIHFEQLKIVGNSLLIFL